MTELRDLLKHELGERACADILQESLEEELEMAAFLEESAPGALGRLVSAGV